jgi:hypothetical protein
MYLFGDREWKWSSCGDVGLVRSGRFKTVRFDKEYLRSLFGW